MSASATSGGVVAAYFLPGGYRQLSPALPPGAAIQALARVDYVDSGAAVGPVGVPATWARGGLLLAAASRRRRGRPVAVPAS
jgi:hypothetical protein